MDNEAKKRQKWKFPSFGGKIKDILLVCVLALVLLLVAWSVFRGGSSTLETAVFERSETEIKVARILQQIEGVGEAEVIVYKDDDEVKSVVVVCDGANDLRVIMDVREVVAAALNTSQKAVKIYLKKE